MDDMISRRAVIDAVHTATYGFICGAEDGDEMTDADKMVLSINKAVCGAINALPNIPNTSNALSALDCVERQAAIEAFEKELSAKYNGHELAIGFVGVESIIRNLPSVQQCDTCRYAGLEWDEEPCDSCTRGGETNHYKPSVQPEKMQLSEEDATKDATFDCISRQHAILAIERNAYRHTYLDQIVDIIKWLPSVEELKSEAWDTAYLEGYTAGQNAQPKYVALHESCTDCPLYDRKNYNCPRFNRVIPMAIRDAQTQVKALSLPSVQPETSTDFIDRRAAVNEIDEWIEAFRENGHKESAADAHFIKVGIGALPSAHPERMTNRQWVDFLSAQFDISRTSAKEMSRNDAVEKRGQLQKDV